MSCSFGLVEDLLAEVFDVRVQLLLGCRFAASRALSGTLSSIQRRSLYYRQSTPETTTRRRHELPGPGAVHEGEWDGSTSCEVGHTGDDTGISERQRVLRTLGTGREHMRTCLRTLWEKIIKNSPWRAQGDPGDPGDETVVIGDVHSGQEHHRG